MCYEISDLYVAQGKNEGGFRNVAVAHSPEQQRWWCQRLELGKHLCAKLALSSGV